MKNRPQLTVGVIALYFMVFACLWAMRELIWGPLLEQMFSEWENVFIGIGLKVLIWVVPSILLVRYFEQDMWLTLNEMVFSPVKWRKYCMVFAGFCLYYIIAAYGLFDQIAIHAGFKIEVFVGVILFVGVTEEAVFRGWLLNATLKKLPCCSAILINAVMFLSIHMPIWYYSNMFAVPIQLLRNSMTVFVLSLIFSWAFIRSKNIFVPILLHTSWDFLYLLFLGWG